MDNQVLLNNVRTKIIEKRTHIAMEFDSWAKSLPRANMELMDICDQVGLDLDLTFDKQCPSYFVEPFNGDAIKKEIEILRQKEMKVNEYIESYYAEIERKLKEYNDKLF